VSDIADTVVTRTVEIARVPAPTGAEATRAAVVRSWWEADGLRDVRTDPTGNVWALVRGGDGPIVVLCAHLDTVFDIDVPHAVRIEGDRLVGPSVGDNSVGLASLAAAGALLGPHGVPVWLLATVGEEGFGNLRGVHAALDAPPGSVMAFIAVEGNYLGRVSTIGVGSVRLRVVVRGPGGHAWEAADSPSAIHAIAPVVASIASIRRPRATSVNVGRIGGGEGINVRASEAWFELDLRADDAGRLASLNREVEDRLRQIDPPLTVDHAPLGDRPAGRVDPGHPLVRAAEQALVEIGRSPSSPATSTDANAAHARGVPAIAVGVTTGSGEHTQTEWIETGPIEHGVRALARTVERFEELTR
jgi:tripeptide aminopeptidase